MVWIGVLLAALLIVLCLVLPIVAIVRTGRIRILELRLAGVEAALLRVIEQRAAPTPRVREAPVTAEEIPAVTPLPAVTPHPGAPIPAVMPVAEPAPTPATEPSTPTLSPAIPSETEHLESVIGQRWLGWIAVLLIFGAAAYFLKYAFENRWIGELGRVALGVAAGLVFVWSGLERYRKDWRYLSQVLTGGGVTILYLSVYAAFGYYHLVGQSTAFVVLVILVAEAHLLALLYNARAIAIMALAGGFLAPVLLSTGRDQYAILFSYIGILDLGMLGIVVAKQWRWIGSVAYLGTQALFWMWYGEHYHPEKRGAVLLFQAAIFLLFMLADLAPNLRKTAAGWEQWIRLVVNPFVFYATCYFLLNDEYHDWMAVLALAMAIVYAMLARTSLALRPSDRRMLLVTVGTALTFVTLAIPVQLESNWITIAWGLEAVVLLWASLEASAPPLRLLSGIVFLLAGIRYLFEDTPWMYRAPFTPVINRYFLGTLALAACVGIAEYLYRRMDTAGASASRTRLAIGFAGVGILWLGSSVEAYSYFDSQATAAWRDAVPDALGISHMRWAGQLSLSVLWSVFAGLMTASGFRFTMRAWRVAGLVLFGITLVKVVVLDISELQQFYRIVALLALGLVLLGVAWAYQRVLRREHAG